MNVRPAMLLAALQKVAAHRAALCGQEPAILRSCLAVVVAFFGCVMISTRVVATAPSVWELTPTEVVVSVACNPECGLSGEAERRLGDEVVRNLDRVVGGPWRLHARTVPLDVARFLLSAQAPEASPPMVQSEASLEALLGAPSQSPESPGESQSADKWFVLRLRSSRERLLIDVREFDARVAQWGPLETTVAHPTDGLAVQAATAVLQAYRPLAVIETSRDQGDSARLRPRGAALAARDSEVLGPRGGDLFAPFVRFNARDGSARAIRAVDWTILEVEAGETAETSIPCKVHTALRSPLAARRGRVEVLALAVRPGQRTTRLILTTSGEQPTPLVGYRVVDVAGPEPVDLGASNHHGQIAIPPAQRALRLLWITSGQRPMAPRLPLVSGTVAEKVVRLPDDSARIPVSVSIRSLQDELLDLIARRQILMAVTRYQLRQNHSQQAASVMGELRKLPTRAEFAARLTAIEQRMPADPRVRRDLEPLLRETRTMLQKHLDPSPVSDLERELRQAETASAQQG